LVTAGSSRLWPADRPYRLDQVVAADLLEDIAGGAGHDRGEQGLVVGEGGEHQHLGLGSGGADLAGGLDAAAVLEPDVHDDHVGEGAVGFGDGLADGGCLGADDDVVVGGQQGLDAVADDLVVVDQHHAQRWGARHVSLILWHPLGPLKRGRGPRGPLPGCGGGGHAGVGVVVGVRCLVNQRPGWPSVPSRSSSQ